MAIFPFRVKPLDGADGYLRWKESVLLGLHMVDVAHVLSDDPPAPALAGGDGDVDGAEAAKKWARDDTLCRGHILAALSDRLLPVYVRHGTGRALWEAVARTYEPDPNCWVLEFEELEFCEDDDDNETLLERLARAESLAIAGSGSILAPRGERRMAEAVSGKLTRDVCRRTFMKGDEATMDWLWGECQAEERARLWMQIKEERKRQRRA